MRSIRVGSRTLIASPVLRSYWHVAAERQRIYHRRLAGMRGPWSEDEILSAHRFTNAYRAADRVSQELIRTQYDGPQSAEDVLLRTLLFRFFNKPETWNLIEQAVGSVSTESFDVPVIDSMLEQALSRGERIYSPAYIIPPPPFGARRKHLNHLRLIEHVLASGAVATRWLLGDFERRHAASVSEPSRADRGRHADTPCRFPRKQTLRDLAPKRRLDGLLELRMPRRAEHRPNRPVRGLLTTNHLTPPERGVATTS
ncbi:hypothetical protein FB560_1199 [Microbacterium saperdae]|uniref:5-hmdU DNA kinase helical domain-containing protein n=1 Tax=Microbacterium saperdae TaxID=69368 RepID=A0A543BL64_9MICO|nr:hypothetical protein FB560_1199 [Microbacterium saperdae]